MTLTERRGELMHDAVHHPDHYTAGGIETIDYLEAKLSPEEFVGYLRGNVLKYGSRLGLKDAPVQEAGKLAWYANRLEEFLKKLADCPQPDGVVEPFPDYTPPTSGAVKPFASSLLTECP